MKELFVELTLAERYALIARLPKKGSYTLMARARELHDKLIPTPKEESDFGIKTDERTGHTTCLPKFRKATVGIPVGETMNDAIKTTLTDLDKGGELGPADVTLYEKFVKEAELVDADKPKDNGQEPKT